MVAVYVFATGDEAARATPPTMVEVTVATASEVTNIFQTIF